MGVSIVMGVPKNEWLIREHPIKMDDLGVPLFLNLEIRIGFREIYETMRLLRNRGPDFHTQHLENGGFLKYPKIGVPPNHPFSWDFQL